MIRRRNRERGSAMLVTVVVIAALLAGGAVLVGVQLQAARSADLSRTGLTATYCAEAGLAAARTLVENNYAQWNGTMCTTPPVCVEPAWITAAIPAPIIGTPTTRDLDGDGVGDFTIALVDNADEIPPTLIDANTDNDLKVFVVSTCTKFPELQKQISELVQFNGAGPCNSSQAGGNQGNGNDNGCN